jgi:hypothetical protein
VLSGLYVVSTIFLLCCRLLGIKANAQKYKVYVVLLQLAGKAKFEFYFVFQQPPQQKNSLKLKQLVNIETTQYFSKGDQ